MEIYFSRQAKNKMRKFKVDQGEVMKAIQFPDMEQPSIKSRRNAWKKRKHNYIRVTYLIENGKIIVVTVTLKEKCPGGDASNENPI